MAFAEKLDISSLLKTPILPTKALLLLAGACLAWVGILSLAFVVLTGTGATAAWIVAGALLFSLVVWALVMGGEFRNAPTIRESRLIDESEVGQHTGSLPRRLAKLHSYRLRFNRPTPRKLSGFTGTRKTYGSVASDHNAER